MTPVHAIRQSHADHLGSALIGQATDHVPEVAEELGVSRPTVRSWIGKGLLDTVADTSPQRVRFASVQQLKGRLGKLRALAKDERRFSQLLREAADQRALEQPGAQEGLQDALAGDTVE